MTINAQLTATNHYDQPLKKEETRWPNGWRVGLQIDGPGLSPGLGHCVVFLGKTLYSHSASLNPGV